MRARNVYKIARVSEREKEREKERERKKVRERKCERKSASLVRLLPPRLPRLLLLLPRPLLLLRLLPPLLTLPAHRCLFLLRPCFLRLRLRPRLLVLADGRQAARRRPIHAPCERLGRSAGAPLILAASRIICRELFPSRTPHAAAFTR